MFPPSDHPEDSATGDFVFQLIDLQPQLRAFIGHLTPVIDIRADVLQEVNLLLWQKRSSFEAGTSFRNWAYTFARYVVMNYQKKAKRDKRLVFSDELMEALAEDFERADPHFEERLTALRRCLLKVPKNERRLLLDRYSEHGAVEQEARAIGRSAAALRGILFRLRIALRKCVENELRDQPSSS
ncbi:sigma-70 family RNA polymerase sigma factor [Luteolibacter pohnpeiensis]|uniref:Sigma-70 family RNA polymerase sigma factor n=1 Tax=Luteolibacter pohnpeiensis TaxID=454153 RepID=A0A934S4R7_9BACT|nr:sigma-70 family RNA polymerase sigma factor [Luteolibacter pohnpeiensis]MBK1882257.1 sigma-70 family RNA polymerase sigma factor [Luteolibacter pohnpeiensis]